MGHIFISYSHKDSSYLHKLVDDLEKEGFEVWIDDRVHYGSEWPKVVTRNLDMSDGVIIVMSNNSFESDMVQNEITRAREKKKPIFPLILDGENWLIVQAKQFVDVRDKSIPTEKFYKRLEEVTQRKNIKAEREAAEKLAQEEANRERAKKAVLEKAAREKAKRDAVAKAKREKDERQAARKAVLTRILSKSKPIIRFIGIIGFVVILFWLGSWGILKLAFLIPTARASLTPTLQPSVTTTKTHTPTSTLNSMTLPTEITDAKGVTKRLVPAGTFQMGSDNGSSDEKPVHMVYLDAFWIDQTEVTNAMYAKCVHDSTCNAPSESFSYSRYPPNSYYGNVEYNDYPVIDVS